MDPATFHIYNASAGSGKTYTLVQAYLKVLFGSNTHAAYRHILGITFTNKAVGEMKARIIAALKSFASPDILNAPTDLFEDLCKDLELEPADLHQRARTVLNHMLHNYAAFDISTIDRFTQKLIRTFAHDLGLSVNYDVELDTDTLLHEAVDRLIAKAGTDKALTGVLIDFALEKADDDKSWDIAIDFYKAAKLLVNENDMPYVEALRGKTLDDFKALNTYLKRAIHETERAIRSQAAETLNLISECGLMADDFKNKYLPKHFERLADGNFRVNFNLKWQEELLAGSTLYPGRVEPDLQAVINEIQPTLAQTFRNTRAAIIEIRLLQNIYKNSTRLSVLNAVLDELSAIKEDRNLILISEFNAIISKAIRSQPVPFIYERIGERFRHFFIDEFQDTSVLQWENLVPLLENALASESGSALLVGDAKQAIYRWRGGKPEQFIDLCRDANPFPISKEVFDLPRNYRSNQEIIDFNNAFFGHLSTFALSQPEYADLYARSRQEGLGHSGGYVELNFLENQVEDRDEAYGEKVLKAIRDVLTRGFEASDICILVRKQKEGVALAEYLSANEVEIISSETLMIDRSPEVAFMNAMMVYVLDPEVPEHKLVVLRFLAEHKIQPGDIHRFYASFINLDIAAFFAKLEDYGFYFNPGEALQLSIYEFVETLVFAFGLVNASNAYIQFYLDLVMEYALQNRSDLAGFVTYYEDQKEKLSIVAPGEKNAVRIMTIHKSKGLEFPVVIFPYAELDIYKEIEPREWYPLDADSFQGFSHALLSYNKDFETYGETGAAIHKRHRGQLEMDNINLLYVALTRAREQLYIVGRKLVDKAGQENLRTFSGLFINYLKAIERWDESVLSYAFGDPQKVSDTEETPTASISQKRFISNPGRRDDIRILTSSGYLWDTKREQARERGNLIHAVMAGIKTQLDIDASIDACLAEGLLNIDQVEPLREQIHQIVGHPQLQDYFSSDYTIYNERDIITSDFGILRPDRLVLNDRGQAVLIDYKSGGIKPEHITQLDTYEKAITDMGLKVVKKVLVYIDDTIELKEV